MIRSKVTAGLHLQQAIDNNQVSRRIYKELSYLGFTCKTSCLANCQSYIVMVIF